MRLVLASAGSSRETGSEPEPLTGGEITPGNGPQLETEPNTTGDRWGAESVDSEAVKLPLPDHIDLFGGPEVEFHQLANESELSQSGKVSDFDDGYDDPRDDEPSTSLPVDLNNLSSLIRDRCMSVPATITVQLPGKEASWMRFWK